MVKILSRVKSSAGNKRGGPAVTSARGPTAQALDIPEVLLIIFSFSQPVVLAKSARVCKKWAGAALDQLWKHLSSVFPLVELILDMDVVKTMTNLASLRGLNDILGGADWDRFRFYAERVRSLEFDQSMVYRSDPETPDLDTSVVANLSFRHPFGAAFLPGLQKLSWTTDRSVLSILPFLSTELKELQLKLDKGNASEVNKMFNALVHRTPGLVTLHLEARASGGSVDATLARWLQTMPNLEKVSLPRCYFTPTLIGAISSLPRLKAIDQSFGSNSQGNQSEVALHLAPDAFPSLVYLGLNASTPSDASRFLHALQGIGSRLSRIVLHASRGIGVKSILTFTSHVAQNCPEITELGLNLFTNPTSSARDFSPLPVELLKSLYPCKELKKLQIGHPFPFWFRQNDVERMGRAWPQMVHLEVCPYPDFGLPSLDQMGSSLSVLTAFAKSMPNLEVLGLYINQEEIHPSISLNLYPQWEFRKLTELFVGLSTVTRDRVRHVGFYIACLCRERPTITYGTTDWHNGFVPGDWDEIETNWEEVHDIVGFAMEVKRAGRSSLAETGTDAGVSA